MATTKISEERIFAILRVGSWVILAGMTLMGLLFGSLKFATGVAVGGVVAILNFYWMHNVLWRLLHHRPEHPGRFVQVRYVARLAVVAVVLYLLIVNGGINLAGLLVGLSIIVITIMILSFYMLSSKGD